MKGTKLLLSFWLATGAFCFLQIVFGPGGIMESARLSDQRDKLELRLEALKAENARLTARYEALRTSPEAIRLEARALGWFRANEVPVRILEGPEFRLPSEAPDFSSVPRLMEETSGMSWFFRLAWPLLFASFYAFFLLVERMWPDRFLWQEWWDRRRTTLPVPLQTGLDFFRK